MTQLTLDDALAIRATDRGIANAATSAGEGWQAEALLELERYFQLWDQDEFMVEHVRQFAYSCGLPHPPSERAWGHVIREAQRLGLVEFVRYEQVRNPKAHRANAAVWRRKQ